jgi:aminocarboxymuconate-semialdehyde decarboxylase
MKIDVFNHVLPAGYIEACKRKAEGPLPFDFQIKNFPALVDMDKRFRIMDQAGEYKQIASMANPPLEVLFDARDALELARVANDELAALVDRHSERFAGAVASIPMNDIEGAVREIERAVRELGMRGIQLYTDVQGRPLDAPEFDPVFAKMAEVDLPILLHPARGPGFHDYPTEDESKYDIWRVFGWLYDTAAAMTRIIFAGIFDRYPNIKIVTHHLGGIVPYADRRIEEGYSKMVGLAKASGKPLPVKKHPYEYYRLFYGDTITVGSVPALECGLAFFGVDQVVFATDVPFDVEGGAKYLREALRVMDAIDIPAEDKQKIYEDNSRRLFKLQKASLVSS